METDWEKVFGVEFEPENRECKADRSDKFVGQ